MKKYIFPLVAGLLMLTACNSNEPKAETAANTGGNAIVENIMTRTSIRQYTDQTISNDTIETLLRAGMAAPTAVNKQPWHFIAITDRMKLDSVAVANPNAGMAKKAPLVIVVCGNLKKALEGPAQAYWVQDCSAATENILLAAHGLGLGAVWTGIYPIKERLDAFNQLLKLPDTIIPLCAIVIGHPAEHPAPKDKWLPENVSYNEFGGQ